MFDNLLSTPLWPIDIWNTSAGNKVTTLRSHLDRNSTFLKGVFPIPTCLLSRKNIWGNVFKNGQVHFLKAVFHKIYLVHSWIRCLIFSTIFHNNFNMCFVHIFPMDFPVLFCFLKKNIGFFENAILYSCIRSTKMNMVSTNWILIKMVFFFFLGGGGSSHSGSWKISLISWFLMETLPHNYRI